MDTTFLDPPLAALHFCYVPIIAYYTKENNRLIMINKLEHYCIVKLQIQVDLKLD